MRPPNSAEIVALLRRTLWMKSSCCVLSLQIFFQTRPEVQEQMTLLNHKRVRARTFRVFPTCMRASKSRIQTVSSLCFMVTKKIFCFNWKTLVFLTRSYCFLFSFKIDIVE